MNYKEEKVQGRTKKGRKEYRKGGNNKGKTKEGSGESKVRKQSKRSKSAE